MQQEKRLKEKIKELPDGGREIRSRPVVVFDGKCNHFYIETGLDPEGVMQAQCRKCPMGRRYRPGTAKIVKGKVIWQKTKQFSDKNKRNKKK